MLESRKKCDWCLLTFSDDLICPSSKQELAQKLESRGFYSVKTQSNGVKFFSVKKLRAVI